MLLYVSGNNDTFYPRYLPSSIMNMWEGGVEEDRNGAKEFGGVGNSVAAGCWFLQRIEATSKPPPVLYLHYTHTHTSSMLRSTYLHPLTHTHSLVTLASKLLRFLILSHK